MLANPSRPDFASARRITFAPYTEELDLIADLAPHIRSLGWEVEVWVLDAADERRAKRTGSFDSIFSLLEAWDPKASPAAEDLKLISELEADLGPFLRRDAILDRNLSGFTAPEADESHLRAPSRWSWPQILSFSAHVLRRVQAHLLETPTSLVVGETNKLWNRLVRYACDHCGVRHVYPLNLTYPPGHLHLLRSLTWEWPELRQNLKDLESLNPSTDERERAMAIVDGVRTGSTRPRYIESTPASAPTIPDRLRLGRVLSSARHSLHGRSLRSHDSPARVPSSLAQPTNKLRRTFEVQRRKRVYGRMISSDLPSSPYVSFFLHLQPEWTVDALAFDFRDQANTAGLISSALPAGFELLVRDHPHSVERRSPRFYGEIASQPGVVLSDHRIPAADLIAHSAAVVTLAGTASFEAMCLGVPSIVLGDIFYQYFPGITRAGSMAELRALLADPSSLPSATTEDAVRAIAALESTADRVEFPGAPGDRQNSARLATLLTAEAMRTAQ